MAKTSKPDNGHGEQYLPSEKVLNLQKQLHAEYQKESQEIAVRTEKENNINLTQVLGNTNFVAQFITAAEHAIDYPATRVKHGMSGKTMKEAYQEMIEAMEIKEIAGPDINLSHNALSILVYLIENALDRMDFSDYKFYGRSFDFINNVLDPLNAFLLENKKALDELTKVKTDALMSKHKEILDAAVKEDQLHRAAQKKQGLYKA